MIALYCSWMPKSTLKISKEKSPTRRASFQEFTKPASSGVVGTNVEGGTEPERFCSCLFHVFQTDPGTLLSCFLQLNGMLFTAAVRIRRLHIPDGDTSGGVWGGRGRWAQKATAVTRIASSKSSSGENWDTAFLVGLRVDGTNGWHKCPMLGGTKWTRI